jgi:putative ABC transport system permease protein
MSAAKPPQPPRWADRFLEWYCRPELLEEIQGDAYELFDVRCAGKGPKTARRAFVWDVLRSFRLSTIRKITIQFSPDMYKSNFKIAWRNLAKHKMYSSIKIGGFAIGIAACLLIALFILDELNYDRHYPETGRIYRVIGEMTEGEFAGKGVDFPAPFAKALKDEFPEFEKVARINPNSLFTGGGNPIRRAESNQNTYEEGFTFADQELLDILQIPMVYGDPKHALDEPNTIVITKRKADKYFPNENPVGKTIIANNNTEKPVKIGGVIADFPPNSHLQYDFLITMKGVEFYPGEGNNWEASNYHTYVLLRPGTDLAKLEQKLMPIIVDKYLGANLSKAEVEQVKRTGRIYLQAVPDIHLHSADIHDGMSHGDIRFVWLFGAIAAFILLIAVINFINLSTARSANRAKEVGLRKTVGSTRGYLIAQFLSESLLFSAFSFLLGLLLAWVLLPYFIQLSGKSLQLPWFSWWFLPSIAASTILVGLLAGIYPAFYLSSFKPIQVLKGKLSKGSKNSGLRSALVVFQFTTSIVLIIGTLVVTRQMNFILNKKLGFEKEQVLLLQGTQTLGDKLPTLKKQLQQLPAVDAVTVSDYLPINGAKRNGTEMWDAKKEQQGNSFASQIWQIDYDYLHTMGMKIVAGRNFTEGMRSDSQGVIINQALAQKLNFTQPLGERITNGYQKLTILGVVEDFHFESMRENIEGMCLVLGNSPNMVAVKLHSDNLQKAVQDISATWKSIALSQPIRCTFLDDSFAQMYNDVKRIGRICTNFALLAIIVACLGLFALSTYLAEQRSKEIGIRKVLGASVGSILGMLLQNFLKLVLIALVIAAPLAWYLMQEWLKDFAYRYQIRWDVFVLAGVAVSLLAVLTIGFQALRSALSNPLDALRSE